VPASKGKRLANFIVDRVVFFVVLLGFAFIYGLLGFDPAVLENVNFIIDFLISSFFYVLYYVIFEIALRGKSIGKVITGTRAVMLDGSEPDANTIIKRSFSRIVPFEPFSYLGTNDGWHDTWCDTMVIDEKLSNIASTVIVDDYEY